MIEEYMMTTFKNFMISMIYSSHFTDFLNNYWLFLNSFLTCLDDKLKNKVRKQQQQLIYKYYHPNDVICTRQNSLDDTPDFWLIYYVVLFIF